MNSFTSDTSRDMSDEGSATNTPILLLNRFVRTHIRLATVHEGIAAIVISLSIFACSGVKISQGPAAGPLQVGPVNPRYFSDGAGNVLYLVGAHTWTNLQDMVPRKDVPVFDYAGYLDFLERHHLNFIRLWRQEEALWEPLPYVRTGPGLALDRRPKFDLSRFNPVFFDRLSARVREAGARGVYVGVMLFQGWGIERKDPSRPEDPWPYHPFNRANNINDTDGDPDGNGDGSETHTLSDVRITEWQDRFVRHVVDVLNPYDNVIYEIANESTPASVPWQEHLIQLIHDYERTKPTQHPVLFSGPSRSSERELWASQAEAVSPIVPAPNVSGYAYLDDPPLNDGRKVVINDTDHLWGIGGTREWVWKSFVRGLNPIYMDPYDFLAFPQFYEQAKDIREEVLSSLGQTKHYADRVPLRTMTPRNELCSTRYCLADPGQAYLIYVPSPGAAEPPLTVEVDLEGYSGHYRVEWFNPRLGNAHVQDQNLPGGRMSFIAPFTGDAVLYLNSAPR